MRMINTTYRMDDDSMTADDAGMPASKDKTCGSCPEGETCSCPDEKKCEDCPKGQTCNC